jgi:hypothetical protein
MRISHTRTNTWARPGRHWWPVLGAFALCGRPRAERSPRPYPAGGIACLNRNLKSGSYVCFTWRRRARFDA